MCHLLVLSELSETQQKKANILSIKQGLLEDKYSYQKHGDCKKFYFLLAVIKTRKTFDGNSFLGFGKRNSMFILRIDEYCADYLGKYAIFSRQR